MDANRLTHFITAYAEGLAAAVTKAPHLYHRKADDTPETYAVRVAMTVADLFQTKGTNAVYLMRAGFKNACKALDIEHSEKSINNYLEVA